MTCGVRAETFHARRVSPGLAPWTAGGSDDGRQRRMIRGRVVRGRVARVADWGWRGWGLREKVPFFRWPRFDVCSNVFAVANSSFSRVPTRGTVRSMHFISDMFTTANKSEMSSALEICQQKKNILTQRACLSENDELRLRVHSSGGWYRPALADGSVVDKVRISSSRRDRARETRFVGPASLPNARVPWRIPPREKRRETKPGGFSHEDPTGPTSSSSPADFPARFSVPPRRSTHR